jgi:hypothetical protein
MATRVVGRLAELPILSRAAHPRSEGNMRSIQSRNRNLGNQNALQGAKTIVRNDSDRRSLRALAALFGYPSRSWHAMRDALRHWASTATCVMKTRVTGGAFGAVALERPGRRAAACRLAAR